MLQLLNLLKLNRKGATAIEYGLIAVGIAVAVGAIAALVGGDIVAMFQRIRDIMSGGA